MKFYFGIYVEYTDPNRPRIAQVMTTVDDLSCEMLADPGLITFYALNKTGAKIYAKDLAKKHNCRSIEFGWGKYKLIKIR